MPTSLRKQLVDRRRVVHGIAIGREQIEHGGHPLDDTGAIALKGARTVLRGGSGSNPVPLPDYTAVTVSEPYRTCNR